MEPATLKGFLALRGGRVYGVTVISYFAIHAMLSEVLPQFGGLLGVHSAPNAGTHRPAPGSLASLLNVTAVTFSQVIPERPAAVRQLHELRHFGHRKILLNLLAVLGFPAVNGHS